MHRLLFLGLIALLFLGSPLPRVGAQTHPPWLDQYREPAARLIAEATSDTSAWQRLAELTDTAGHRLSGSPGLERAIAWAVAEMTRDGLENVHIEKVVVPHWVRGNESVEIVEPASQSIGLLGLGGSVATPAAGIQADLLVVRSFQELDGLGQRATGRIVLLNVPFTTYAETVRVRADGASRAARAGAVASLIRSVGPDGLPLPHTGTVRYADGAPRIPAAAIASEDADRLQRMADRGTRIVIRLKMGAHFEADVDSANVIGEVRGREQPDEVVVVGAHLDSWDVGTGASDDVRSAGCRLSAVVPQYLCRLPPATRGCAAPHDRNQR